MTESDRNYDNISNLRGSRILDDDIINSSAKYSPGRMDNADIDFPGNSKHQNNPKNKSLDRINGTGALSQSTSPN